MRGCVSIGEALNYFGFHPLYVAVPEQAGRAASGHGDTALDNLFGKVHCENRILFKDKARVSARAIDAMAGERTLEGKPTFASRDIALLNRPAPAEALWRHLAK